MPGSLRLRDEALDCGAMPWRKRKRAASAASAASEDRVEELLEERARGLRRSGRFTRRRETAEFDAVAAESVPGHADHGPDGNGDAALCVDCSAPIHEERRAVVPSAIRCVDCQALHEGMELARYRS